MQSQIKPGGIFGDEEGEPARTQESEQVEENEPRRPVIEFCNVSLSFEDQKVLDGVSFEVEKSEIKIILSGSGGGKSTILKLILGLLKPDEGEIFVDGEEITEMDETELQRVRNKIGIVLKRRFAAAISRFALSMNSIVLPSLSRVRYRYFHCRLTLM